eukprot:365019-Chlamydomonas_euryale.AAC.21
MPSPPRTPSRLTPAIRPRSHVLPPVHHAVQLYGPTLVNTPYQERRFESDQPGQYEGETALHIAIVNRDFDMVRERGTRGGIHIRSSTASLTWCRCSGAGDGGGRVVHDLLLRAMHCRCQQEKGLRRMDNDDDTRTIRGPNGARWKCASPRWGI